MILKCQNRLIISYSISYYIYTVTGVSFDLFPQWFSMKNRSKLIPVIYTMISLWYDIEYHMYYGDGYDRDFTPPPHQFWWLCQEVWTCQRRGIQSTRTLHHHFSWHQTLLPRLLVGGFCTPHNYHWRRLPSCTAFWLNQIYGAFFFWILVVFLEQFLKNRRVIYEFKNKRTSYLNKPAFFAVKSLLKLGSQRFTKEYPKENDTAYTSTPPPGPTGCDEVFGPAISWLLSLANFAFRRPRWSGQS